MGYLGKIITGAAIGVGAIAAAPFTGGGSLLAGATLVESLAGASVVAAGAGLLGAGAGAISASMEEDEHIEDIKNAKEKSFEDGIKEGKIKSVEEIKKYADFYIAVTAVAYYFARIDGSISKEEQMEIDYNLNIIKQNCDISDAVKNKIVELTNNGSLSWDEVERYLNNVSVDTLNELMTNAQAIVEASDGITIKEADAIEKLKAYIGYRYIKG